MTLGLRLDFRTKRAKRRSFFSLKVKRNEKPPNQSLTSSTSDFSGFQVESAGFYCLAIFNVFPVFYHNQTGLEVGYRLNRSDQPVQSDF